MPPTALRSVRSLLLLLSLGAGSCAAIPNPPPPADPSLKLSIENAGVDSSPPAFDLLEELARDAPLVPPRPEPPAPVWEFGALGGVSLGDGEPSNDQTTYGVFARWNLSDDWSLRFALEQSAFDFERPAKILGITQDPNTPTVDADALSTAFGVWIERTHRTSGSSNEWLLGVGLGVASVDVDDAGGPVQGGGTFDIETDAGTELTLGVEIGYRRRFLQGFALEALARAQQHFADWELDDRVSGTSGSVDDYLITSFLLGISYGF